MELYVSEEALEWLEDQGYPDLDGFVDAYEFEEWLEENGISYTGNFTDGFEVIVNASERYSFKPNNEFEG